MPAPLPAENDNPSVPVISLQPISESVASGEAVTLNVIATGSGTLKYTWRKEGKNRLHLWLAVFYDQCDECDAWGAMMSSSVINWAQLPVKKPFCP